MAESETTGSWASRLPIWLGVVSTLVSVSLTVFNARTKAQIDAAETRLHEREASVDESKERVARYAWVRSLYGDLKDPDPKTRIFATSLIRLALSEKEANQLFAGWSGSPDKELQQAGQAGLASIQTEGISKLIAQTNADSAEERKAAVAILVKQYSSSTNAIAAALQLFTDPGFQSLSPSAVINLLYFLGATDPASWTPEQVQAGRAAIARVETGHPGSQTQQALASFKALLEKVQTAK